MILSRLDSSRSRPSIWTGNRCFPLPGIVVLLHTLLRRLVRAQPQEPGEPQPPVGRAVAVPDLDHQFRTYPVRAARILARHRTGGERRSLGGERPEHVQQLLLAGAADAA